MKVDVKSNTRRVKSVDRFGVIGDRITPVVEVWIDGICFIHECNTNEEARALVIKMAYALGIE